MGDMSRKRLFLMVGIGGVCLAVVLGLAIGIPLSKRSTSFLQQAQELLQEMPLIDGHNDLAWLMYKEHRNVLDNFPLDTGMVGKFAVTHTDLPRLRSGHVGAQFWALFVTCETQNLDAVRSCLDQADVIHRFLSKYKDDFEFVTSAKGIEDAFEKKKIGSLIGMEGGHCIDSSLGLLRMFYNLGVRYMTLTHNCNTPWADNNIVDSIDPETPAHPAASNGLTSFGKDLIIEMNRMGMFVDLSHVSHKAMEVALEVAQAPVIFSHSSAYSLCNHHRNVRDDILRKMPDNGGVVMVNFYPYFITCKEVANVSDIADHIDHIKNTAGVDHVGIGADYDGVDTMPTGLEDVSTYPNLFAELLKRSWSKEDLKKLAGGNLLRAMKQMEKVSESLSSNTIDDQYLPDERLNMTCKAPWPQE